MPTRDSHMAHRERVNRRCLGCGVLISYQARRCQDCEYERRGRVAQRANDARAQGCDEEGCDGSHYAKFKCKVHFTEWEARDGALVHYSRLIDDGVYMKRDGIPSVTGLEDRGVVRGGKG